MTTRSLLAALLLAATAAPAVGLDAAPPMMVTKRISAPDGNWDYVNVSADGKTLLLSRSDGVMTVDFATGTVNPHLVAAQRTHGVVTATGEKVGMVTSSTSGGALLFKVATGRVIADIKTGKKPDAALFDPATGMFLVMDNAGGGIAVIDPAAARLVGTVAIDGALESAVADGHGLVYVNVEDKGVLATVDVARRTVIRSVKLTGCDEPGGLALTRQGYLIAACQNGVAKIVVAKTGKQLGDVAIGSRPDATLYDAVRERAYVPTGGDGMLTMLDTVGVPRAIGVVTTQKGSRTGAVDPATGNVYLPGARFAAAEAGQRPKQIPGSFEILVVGK